MHKIKILLAEDMLHERLVIEAKLKNSLAPQVEAEFTMVDSAEAAVQYAKKDLFDLVILDIDFSQSPNSNGMTGLQASKQIKFFSEDLYVVIVSSDDQESTMTSAVDDCYADWYLRRAKMSFDELAWVARQALLTRLHREEKVLESKYCFLTVDRRTKRFLRIVDRVQPHQNTLIYGETGTGKELIARRIHANAKAFDQKRPLKVLDCSALSPQIFESEIFGHRKGSFTGAASDRVGALQLVNGGDLFLDEIHNIPLSLQQKLLRVLNDGIFSPVGSNEEIRSTFRIIAATNIPIQEAIRTGKLLPDFVERIRKIRLEVPALRERPSDISLLIQRQLESAGSLDKEFSGEAIELLQARQWPGNIRELKSVVDTAVAEVKVPIIAKSHIVSLFPHTSGDSTASSVPESREADEITNLINELLAKDIPLANFIEQIEDSYLLKVAGASTTLRDLEKSTGYSRSTLHRRLQKLGIVTQDSR